LLSPPEPDCVCVSVLRLSFTREAISFSSAIRISSSWLHIASVWSAPGSSLVTPLPPSLGPALTDQVCFRELGAGPIQSPVNLWLPVSAAKAESPRSSFTFPHSCQRRSASGARRAPRLLLVCLFSLPGPIPAHNLWFQQVLPLLGYFLPGSIFQPLFSVFLIRFLLSCVVIWVLVGEVGLFLSYQIKRLELSRF
jgi:hypothetical protein